MRFNEDQNSKQVNYAEFPNICISIFLSIRKFSQECNQECESFQFIII